MRQILFSIPVPEFLGSILNFLLGLVGGQFTAHEIPVYGYGLMLFFAFIGCIWLARRLCKREDINDAMIPDLAIWLFVSGIIGGRVVFVATKWEEFQQRPFWEMVKLWDGGLVLYGALFGGAAGYYAFYYRYLKKEGVSNWKMHDVVAPCIVLGIAFGRIGCLFTGCCYGNVACTTCPVVPIHFPVYATSAPPHHFTAPAQDMIKREYQTVNGFRLKDGLLQVEAVEPQSPAASAGLQAGDFIVQVNGKELVKQSDIVPGDGGVQLTVFRGTERISLPPFMPTSIGLNPTQPFETISMCLLLFFMLSYYPYKRRDGEMVVILLIVYAIHRFLNEMLRLDIDPGLFGLSLSQLISLGIFAAGVLVAIAVSRRPLISATPKAELPIGAGAAAS
jgi:phosphatidylglycerol---prolipoprotein diacylglyceryl transferase